MEMKNKNGHYINYALLLVIGGIMIFPFIWMICTSFKIGNDVNSLSLLPKEFSLENYKTVLASSGFLGWFWNSIVVAVLTSISVLIFDPLVGYTFNKFRFRGKEIVFAIILSTMMIPTEMMVIPWYLMINQLGWNDTYWSLLFPGITSAFGIFLTRQFFAGVPKDLIEAARIDGLSELKIYTKIALPLIKPALSALVIFTFLGNWNAYLWPVIALDSKEMYTITVGLALFSSEARSSWELIMTGASIATIPVFIVFLILQKQIIHGIQLSGIKV